MIITILSAKGGVGKTTTSIHIAAYFQQKAPTLLIDGDINRSSLEWSHRGELPFKVVDEKSSPKYIPKFTHHIIDTPARPSDQELEALADAADLLVVPTTPDALSLSATAKTVEQLTKLEADYKVLLTIIPPPPSKEGPEARQVLMKAEIPIFTTEIRRLAVYRHAAVLGCVVSEVSDKYAGIGWRAYEQLGREITS